MQNIIMCSLKLFVTIYFVFSCCGRAFALDTPSSDLENAHEYTQPAGRTSVLPEEIHNLFSNETNGHTSANDTTGIIDKVSVPSIDSVTSKTSSQHFLNKTKEALTLLTPSVATPGSITGVVGTSSSKLDAGPVSNQLNSTERVTHNVEFPLEGGGTVANLHPSSLEPAARRVNVTSVQGNESLSLQNIYSDTEQSNKTSTVVARKGAEYKPSKIVPRKGVESCSCCPNVTSSENCTMCCGSPNELNLGEEIDVNNKSSQGVGNTTVTNSNNTTVMEQWTNKSTVVNSTEAKKTKATKPLYTLDAVNDNVGNVSIVQTPTKKLEQGNNYVVPVVGTLLMVPLIAVLSVFMYKKGCEFWERRHYRRMDFLIDGMYND